MVKNWSKKEKLIASSIILLVAVFLFFGMRADVKPNLEKFYHLSKSNPLFYSGYINTTELRISVQKLVATEKDATEKLGISLYPKEYLLYLPEVIDANNRFFAEPTKKNAEELLSRYEEAAAAYENGIRELIKSYNGTINNTGRYECKFMVQSTNIETVIEDANLIKANAAQLREEIRKRKNCLHYGACEQVKNSVNLSAIQVEEKNFSLVPLELLMKNFSYAKGPYIIKSSCWGWDKGFLPKTYLMYLFYKDGRPYPKLATDIYYWDVTYRPYYNYSFELITRGVTLNDQLETADYRCPDQEFYYDITTLDFFIDRLKEKRVFTEGIKNYIAAEDFALGNMLESKLLSNAYPSSDDMERLDVIYSKVYGILKEKNVSDAELIWNYRMLIENKMVMLPQMLGAVQHFLEIWKMISEINGKDDAAYLIFTRADYSLMFMPYSKSVWRISSRPQYIIKKDSYLSPEFVLYSQMKDKPLEELKKYQIDDFEVTAEILSHAR